MRKRMLAWLLVLAMAASILPVGVLATDDATATTNTNLENQVTYSGSDSFGSMLAERIDDNQAEQEALGNGFQITDITMYGTTASVTLNAPSACTLVVALYDDDGVQMLASGTADVEAESTDINVDIHADTMPEHYLVKGFLLEINTLNPLCEAYSTPMYTEAMQTLKGLSTTDFSEERVLNLDDNTETNFAVYGKDTIVIEANNSAENVVVSADDAAGVYVIENADEQILSLQPGDVFAYPNGNDVLIVKVQTISVDGTTVTITADDTDMEDVFEYVKIDAEDYTANAEIDASHLEEGIEYEGLIEDSGEINSYAVDLEGKDEYSASYKFVNKKIGNDDNNIKLNGSVSLKIGIKVQCYIAWSQSYLKAEFSYSAKLEGKISGKITMVSIPLAYYGFSPIPGLYISFTPSIVLSASAELSLNMKFEGKIGFQASIQNGFQNISEAPSFSCEWKLEGKVFLGVSLEPKVSIVSEHIAKADAEAMVGGEVTATLAPTKTNHTCSQCLDGNVDGKVEVSAKAKFANKWEVKGKAESKQKLFDFYYSFDHSEWGIGTCPYIGNGVCGKNLTWQLENGTLTISGTGAMESYEDSPAPWYNIRTVIQEIVIYPGVTLIGDYAFYYCDRVTGITIPDSVVSIGAGAFEGCRALSDIIIPAKITAIKDRTFLQCNNLTSIIIPNNVTSLGYQVFAACNSLTSISIPSSVTSIGLEAFKGCSSLTEINVASKNTRFCSIGGVLFDFSKTRLIACPGAKDGIYTIPDGVTIIDPWAFSECRCLNSITIPDGVTSIGNGTFDMCDNLTSITIPSSVTSIGWGAFDYYLGECRNLADVYYSGSESEWGNIKIEENNGNLVNATIHYNSAKTTFTTAHTSIVAPLQDGGQIDFQQTNRCADSQYVLIASKSSNMADKLSPANLLHIDQKSSDANGNISFTYPAELESAYITLHGPEGPCARGHTWDNGTITKSSTCTTEGEKVYTCFTCGLTKTEAIAMLEHQVELKESQAATCIDAGYTGDKVCTVCGETVEAGSVIPATGHQWDDGKVTKQPTATEKGVTTYTCTTCGETRTEEIPATDSPAVPDQPTTPDKPTEPDKPSTPDVPTVPTITFVDVPAGAYYYDAVNWAVSKGITNGTGVDEQGNNYFSPDASCTRAQAVTFLWRAAGTPEPSSANNPFTDVPAGEYYYKAVLWAVEKGITKGTSDTEFSPNTTCNRAQIVTFLHRYEGEPKAEGQSFNDVPANEYYYAPVIWAVSKGVTNGTGGGNFSPMDDCTRGQIVTFLYRDMVQ